MLYAILLPAITGALIRVAALVGYKKSSPVYGVIASCSCLASFFLLYFSGYGSIDLGQWFAVEGISLRFSFLLDDLSYVMSLIVTGVGALIHFFAISYMADDEENGRFFSYLNGFIFFMLILVLGGELPVLFLGWEGVGVCSYLLISFWNRHISYSQAGSKAFIVNRIGDLGLLLAMATLLASGKGLSVSEVGSSISDLSPMALSLVAFGLVVAACGKSAQFPLMVWLPDAMAGPTPVSALIHAATMVTAGVYLLIRGLPIIGADPLIIESLGYIAGATALYGAISACFQNDLKKALAYSTISQLGLMFIAIASQSGAPALFHILTHAFFKAGLFLAAGAVLFVLHHEQDMRKMGGLHRKQPFLSWIFLVFVLAASGLPPFAGYYSKHAITDVSTLMHLKLFAYGTSILTAFYMARVFFLVFKDSFRGDHEPPEGLPVLMKGVLLILALGSIISGVGIAYHGSIGGLQLPHADFSVLPTLIASWPAVIGLGAAWFVYGRGFKEREDNPFFRSGMAFDALYRVIFVYPLNLLSKVLNISLNKGVFTLLENGIVMVSKFGRNVLLPLHSGQLRVYAAVVLAGVVVFVIFTSV